MISATTTYIGTKIEVESSKYGRFDFSADMINFFGKYKQQSPKVTLLFAFSGEIFSWASSPTSRF